MSNSHTSTTPEPIRLRTASERAACQAMFELLEGSIRCHADGELSVDTEGGRYRFIEGVCFAAPQVESVGASLVGWLVESERASAVTTRWRCGARAVLARGGAAVWVTGATVILHYEGAPVDDGFSTHDGRLVFVHESDVSQAQPASTPAIEIDVEGEGEIELDPEDVQSQEWDDEDDRPTLPPCPAGAAVLSTERMLHVLDEPSDPTYPRPPSNAAPPAWALTPMFAPVRDSRASLDDEVDTVPRAVGKAADVDPS